MVRKIIKINEEKCNGCGACASACHEGAIEMVNGKATLTREDYCDGFGDCLPACPANAISFEEREAPAYDEQAVNENKAKKAQMAKSAVCSCPGMQPRALNATSNEEVQNTGLPYASMLAQWPCQIKLLPETAPYYDGANLLVAADCTAYAYANFHGEFMKNHITAVGCPKLDGVDYTEKLTRIIANNNVKSVKIVRMQVPCCAGLENAVKNALKNSGKFIPWQVVTISVNGKIVD